MQINSDLTVIWFFNAKYLSALLYTEHVRYRMNKRQTFALIYVQKAVSHVSEGRISLEIACTSITCNFRIRQCLILFTNWQWSPCTAY